MSAEHPFNAITKAGAECANYPFCNNRAQCRRGGGTGQRLDKLAALYNSRKITPTAIEFVDIAGLVKGASKGEGLGNKFLSHIRSVDAIVHVVRCFKDDNIAHVSAEINPVSDAETINLELIFSDIESLERKREKVLTALKGDAGYKAELDLIDMLLERLSKGLPVRMLNLKDEERKTVESYFLLTSKPVIYVANITEDEIGKPDNQYVIKLREIAASEGAEIIVLSAKIEAELAALSDEDRKMFEQELNIDTSGLNKLITACYKLLGLISFLTAGEKETRAWTIKRGAKAPQAAGKIHSDFEKGFIRAEVIDYDTLIELRSYTLAKEKGKVRSEGKDYIVKDGDVILFRFNV